MTKAKNPVNHAPPRAQRRRRPYPPSRPKASELDFDGGVTAQPSSLGAQCYGEDHYMDDEGCYRVRKPGEDE